MSTRAKSPLRSVRWPVVVLRGYEERPYAKSQGRTAGQNQYSFCEQQRSMETNLGNIEIAMKSAVVQLLDIQQLDLKIESLTVHFFMHHCMESKCVVGTS